MIKILFITSLLLLNIEARENPFFPSDGEADIFITSNEITSLPQLKRATVTLPTDARVIESVTINYKNLDGSLSTKTVQLENLIDWHLPIFISQNYNEVKSKRKGYPVALKIKKVNFKQIAKIRYAKFLSSNKTLKIITKDKLIRSFTLVKPHRVVLDFKRDSHMKSYVKNSKNNIFKAIRVGNHSGYYRVVVELDGHYKSDVNKLKNGYAVIVKW